MNWYRTDMAVIAFAITLATFFLSGYLQLSATQASTRALRGLFENDHSYHHRHAIHGGVASESSVCSQIGIDLLKIGGNAADAVCSISGSFCFDLRDRLCCYSWSAQPSVSALSVGELLVRCFIY